MARTAKEPVYIDLERDVLESSAVMIVARDVWERLGAIGVSRTHRGLIVAMGDPNDTAAVRELEIRTGLQIIAVRANSEAIRSALRRSYDD